MFYYILQYYQKEIYSKNNTRSFKDFSWKEKVMIITLYASVIGYIAFTFFKNITVSLIFVLIMLIDILFLMKYAGSHWNTSSIELMKRYEETKIEKLKTFLNNKDVNMYNKNSIEWLTQMCEKEIAKQSAGKLFNPIKAFFNVIVYPIVAATAAIVIKDMAPDAVIVLATFVLGLLCVIFTIVYVIYPLVENYLNKDKKLFEAFQTDLEYILLKL